MNEYLDPLEIELAALKPEQPSRSLRDRIAEQLNRQSTKQSPWRFASKWPSTVNPSVRTISVAAAIAACALAAFVLRVPAPPTIFKTPVEVPEPFLANALDEELPSVWTYQRALRRSPADLEDLLHKHASHTSRAEPTPAHLFIRSDRGLLKGEL